MSSIVKMEIWQFALIYILLIIVLLIMKRCRIHQSKILFVASIRMTVQLILAGFVLMYIFKYPHPIFTILYVAVMTGFAIIRVFRKSPGLSRPFKWAVGCSLGVSGLSIILFFVGVVVGQSVFNPQYVIPISGMVMGNAMTGTTLGVKTFRENLRGRRSQLEVLLNMGVQPRKILLPFVNQAVETAMLPTLNSMAGMGIVALPGMMTGQILSGTLPTTAILYQIAIMIAICTVVSLSVFGSLQFGYRTLYNKKNQFIFISEDGETDESKR